MAQHPILDERAALCTLMADLGPDAPTWSGDWTTRDLAAHLLVRETRPDAGPGLLVGGALARHTERVRGRCMQDNDYDQLAARLRTGPTWRWPGALAPSLDVHEWFVHHEDVRRPNGGTERDLGPLQPLVWKSLAMWGKRLTKGLPVGVVLRTPNGDELVANTGDRTVTLTATPGELMLRVFGRPVDVTITGDDDAVATFNASDLGL